MIHEEAALKLHSAAQEFRAVKARLSRTVFGWTFQVPDSKGGALVQYGWVTFDGEAARTLVRHQSQAEWNLKSYLRSRSCTNELTVGIVEGGR